MTSGTECINTNTTDLPLYNDMLKNPEYFMKAKGRAFKIAYMPPRDYIRLCELGNKLCYPELHRPFIAEQELVSAYMRKMLLGIEFPMPVIEFHKTGNRICIFQEGRHRALAAEKAGCKTIPVMIVFPYDKKEVLEIIGKIPLLKKYLTIRGCKHD